MIYYRPIVSAEGPFRLASGWARFAHVEVLQRGQPGRRIPASDMPADLLDRLTAPRAALMGVAMDTPALMGILNVTPDSFSDGGDYGDVDAALARALQMQAEGAVIIDVGGESTRPGAAEVPVAEEIMRVAPVIAAIRAQSDVAISLDTRKAAVVGAVAQDVLINDVSAMRFDASMAATIAARGLPVCLMHSVATPETMNDHAAYDDVLLDVYDHLAERILLAEAAGIARDMIMIDPGIGFAKTVDHNLALIRGMSLFHGLGCPILLGASRKRFIGTLGHAPAARARVGGSVAVALEGARQGVQLLRVHDIFITKQAIDLHMAISGTGNHDT